MKDKVSIHWFRQDLRLNDNPSLNYLSNKSSSVVCVYIYDNINCDRELGSASKIWLHHSLNSLNSDLNGKLIILKGDPLEEIDKLRNFFDIQEITWNRCYEPWSIKRDAKIKEYFKDIFPVKSFNGLLLWEPWNILKDNGTPYKVFTPYYKRGCLANTSPAKPQTYVPNFSNHNFKDTRPDSLGLLTGKIWEKKIHANWEISELSGLNLMKSFFSSKLNNYAEGRNFPSKKNVSRLSPYIHWGQLSVNTLWNEAEKLESKGNDINLEIFKSELAWREFAYYLLYHCPKLSKENLQTKFDKFPWKKNTDFFNSWIKGKTGYPIIDAGMRELYQTGYMHNRVRMIVGSFLVKNLLIDWRDGENWFWDCLFDASPASNPASWQWVSGTGTDSAPYFRIFNPITQGKKFDPKGEYIKKFVPELKNLPDKYIFSPWETPDEIQKKVKVFLGKDYPAPLVDIKESRERALLAFTSIKQTN